eukprot:gene16785-19135_t
MKEWSTRRSVTLKFQREEKCKFVREQESDVGGPSGLLGRAFGSFNVITRVKEYIFSVEEVYICSVHSGVGDDPNEVTAFRSYTSTTELVTRQNTFPLPESSLRTEQVNVSWLLRWLDEQTETPRYSIDRSHPSCHTPRRNPDAEEALAFFADLSRLAGKVESSLRYLHGFQAKHCTSTNSQIDCAQFTAQDVFNPVLPLFEQTSCPSVVTTSNNDAVISAALSLRTVSSLLAEQQRSLHERCSVIAALFEIDTTVNTATVFRATEATMLLAVVHLQSLVESHRAGYDFIEDMIRQQIVAAVGKELSTRDFAQYMTFHNRKIFKEAYQPQPFSYAVRRSPVHSPVTVEVTPSEPIYTVSQHMEDAPHMEFALNATTTIKFGGERHLHGWMAHRFSGQAMPQLKLVAETCQFSSYVVLIGRIASAKLFQPKYGFIVQNKDEFRIPLSLEQIPTAKEFKDAISSLSPEQQRFAKAFRSMQLESTLFGVCVIQIKPQLEKVLKLQADSLTKEIKLTQDLMQLFIKYQIPSDLLSFNDSVMDGPSVPAEDRLIKVKEHVQAMQDMLASAKDEKVAAVQEKVRIVRLEMERQIEKILMRGEMLDSLEPQSAVVGTLGFNSQRLAHSGPPSGSPAALMSGSKSECETAEIGPAHVEKAAQPVMTSLSNTRATGENTPPAQIECDTSSANEQRIDYTKYPNKLEEMYTQHDPNSSLRPTIINPGATWTKHSQAGLLSAPQTTNLSAGTQATEKSAAYDLLDALTRSGALPIEHASLHVIIAATHCFDQSVMYTVVQKNVNPIERVERSTLIMASTIHNLPVSSLVHQTQVERLAALCPWLL